MISIKKHFILRCLLVGFFGVFCGCTTMSSTVKQERITSMTEKESLVWGYIDTGVTDENGITSVYVPGLLSMAMDEESKRCVYLHFRNIQTSIIHLVKIPFGGREKLFSVVLPEGEYKFFIIHPWFSGQIFPTRPLVLKVPDIGKAIYIGDFRIYETSPNIRFVDKFKERLAKFESLYPSFKGECVKRWITEDE